MNRFVVAEPLWCTGCNTCLAACSDVHKTQGLQQHPRLALAKTSTLTAPVVCHHCEEALACRSARLMPSPRGMMRSNSTKASVLAASFAPWSAHLAQSALQEAVR
ncbi:hydrogenase 4 Fe-S subunit [Escherichia coli]|nr:hydrogenase 4 Fe-S subunit [Escherichia coli]